MCDSISDSSDWSALGCWRMRAMTVSQWRCCAGPPTSGVVEMLSGIGGGTASCTSRAEGYSAALHELCAAPPLCVVDGGAESYFILQLSVV